MALRAPITLITKRPVNATCHEACMQHPLFKLYNTVRHFQKKTFGSNRSVGIVTGVTKFKLVKGTYQTGANFTASLAASTNFGRGCEIRFTPLRFSTLFHVCCVSDVEDAHRWVLVWLWRRSQARKLAVKMNRCAVH